MSQTTEILSRTIITAVWSQAKELGRWIHVASLFVRRIFHRSAHFDRAGVISVIPHDLALVPPFLRRDKNADRHPTLLAIDDLANGEMFAIDRGTARLFVL